MKNVFLGSHLQCDISDVASPLDGVVTVPNIDHKL